VGRFDVLTPGLFGHGRHISAPSITIGEKVSEMTLLDATSMLETGGIAADIVVAAQGFG
jgi:hypothetical protein